MERRDYKQNSVCSAIFYYLENKTNKQKSGDILMPLEAFTATKSFMYIFELCTIMHKASLPVSHSHRNGTHPGNHSTHVSTCPEHICGKQSLVPILIIASFLPVRNDVLCEHHFFLPRSQSLAGSLLTRYFLLLRKKRKLEF